jgi:hypothetical protein
MIVIPSASTISRGRKARSRMAAIAANVPNIVPNNRNMTAANGPAPSHITRAAMAKLSAANSPARRGTVRSRRLAEKIAGALIST